MTAIITCSIEDATFESHFAIDKETPEYMIADEAYRLAILFAQTQFIARFGRLISGYDFGEFLKNLIMIIKSRRENDERYFYGLLIGKELS